MKYQIMFTEQAKKEINKCDHTTQHLLKKWLNKHLVNCENPRAFGKGLTADKSGLWRYRIGNYRLICSIQDKQLIVLALSFGKRSNIYKD